LEEVDRLFVHFSEELQLHEINPPLTGLALGDKRLVAPKQARRFRLSESGLHPRPLKALAK
jgi:hypothetical protein